VIREFERLDAAPHPAVVPQLTHEISHEAA